MAEAVRESVGFSNKGRVLGEDDEIRILSVGVDIGSSTSHLVFSGIVLECVNGRHVVVSRHAFYQSEILLTPYTADGAIDAELLGNFIERQYSEAEINPDEIDTGALILTGVAVRRSNARRIGELFAKQAGKMVAVSAGDSLETIMAAHGSGAVLRSEQERSAVINVDIGGGTSKLAIAKDGKVVDVTAVEVGARLVCVDDNSRVTRLEEAGKQFAADLGFSLKLGDILPEDRRRALAARMADRLMDAIKGETPMANKASLLRLDPLSYRGDIDVVQLSGGVSEYFYGRETKSFGDLGPLIAAEVRQRIEAWGPRIEKPNEGIRATVIGASQYTTQVSGSTIFVSPFEILPLRNIPVIAPVLPLDGETLDSAVIAGTIKAALKRLDLLEAHTPVAIFASWSGSASFQRLDAFCKGIAAGLDAHLAQGFPVVLAGDNDVGGLIGIHFKEEMHVAYPVVSIDGLDLQEFDFIDIGAILDRSGATPVVIKSLIFPNTADLGKVASSSAPEATLGVTEVIGR